MDVFHFNAVRLKADFIYHEPVVNIGIWAYPIRGVLAALRATLPEVRCPFPSCLVLYCLLIKIAAGTSTLPPGY